MANLPSGDGSTTRSSFGNRFMYQHAMKAQEEMHTLHKQFYRFIKDEVL